MLLLAQTQLGGEQFHLKAIVVVGRRGSSSTIALLITDGLLERSDLLLECRVVALLDNTNPCKRVQMSRRRHSAGRGRTAPKRSSPSHFPLGHPRRFSSRATRHHYLLGTPHRCIAGTPSRFHCEAIGSPSDASCIAFPTPLLSSSAPLKPMASLLNPKSSQHPWLHDKHASTRKRTLCFHYLLLLRVLPLQSILLRLTKTSNNSLEEQRLHSLPFPFAFCEFNLNTTHNSIIKSPKCREGISERNSLFANYSLPHGREVQEIVSAVAVAQFAHFGQ